MVDALIIDWVWDIHQNKVCVIGWDDDGYVGGILGQDEDDGLGESPTDTEEWEHWIASKTARSFEPAHSVGTGFVWDNEAHAKKALKAIRVALKAGNKPVPDWATKALAEGWKPPKNWKP